MKQKQKNTKKDILFVLISSFIVVVAWVAFNIYHIYITSTINETIQTQLIPITPIFDPQTIKDLQKRIDIVPIFSIQATTISSESATPSPAVSPAPAIPTAAPYQVTPEASTSGIVRLGQ